MKCPHCLNIIRNSISEKNKIQRIELIKNNILKYNNNNILFMRIKKLGYTMSRRTFKRDLELIEKLEK